MVKTNDGKYSVKITLFITAFKSECKTSIHKHNAKLICFGKKGTMNLNLNSTQFEEISVLFSVKESLR